MDRLIAACQAKLNLYTDREIEFLRSVVSRRSLTQAQIKWLSDLAAREPIDFAAINTCVLPILAALCRRWLSDGKLMGKEWVARNPTRVDGSAGSFRINITTGRWADFATQDVGGDPISLAAYLFHQGDQRAAASSLNQMLGE